MGDSRVCHWRSYFILKPSVIYYWTDPRQHEIYPFYEIRKQSNNNNNDNNNNDNDNNNDDNSDKDNDNDNSNNCNNNFIYRALISFAQGSLQSYIYTYY